MRALKAIGLSLLASSLWSLAWALMNVKTEAVMSPLLRDGALTMDSAAFYAGAIGLWQVLAGFFLPSLLGRLTNRLAARSAAAVPATAALATLPVLSLCAILTLRHPGAGALALAWWGTSLAAAALTAFVLSRLAAAASDEAP